MKRESTSSRPPSRFEGLSRRSFFTGLSLALFSSASRTGLCAESQATPNPSRSVLLVQPANVDELNIRTKIVLELDGQLRIKNADPKAAEDIHTAEVKGKSTLEYLEKIAFTPGSPSATSSVPVAAARRYAEAGVENWIAGSAASYRLPVERSETLMMLHNGQWQQYCEENPLDARDVQLLHSPINSAAIELLLPLEPAKRESTWVVRADDAKHVFNLDAVHKSTLQARISKVEKGVATIELEGELDATANSVPTRLHVKGNLQAAPASGCALITWLGLAIKEEREISQSEPGFDITARVRMIRAETESKISIDADSLRQLASKDDPGRWLIRLQSTAGRYSMLADRRWHIHLDSGEDSVLRMVENNTIIAQCNITRLAELEPGQQLTLEGLQADIRTTLGEGFGSFLEAREELNAAKLRSMRCVVSGELEEVPIQWIYTHLSDDSGRRLAMIFTMGGNVTDRFAAADEQMASSFEMLPEPDSSGKLPTVAPETPAAL